MRNLILASLVLAFFGCGKQPKVGREPINPSMTPIESTQTDVADRKPYHDTLVTDKQPTPATPDATPAAPQQDKPTTTPATASKPTTTPKADDSKPIPPIAPAVRGQAPVNQPSNPNGGKVWVNGYTTKSGKVVPGYWRNAP